jgi:hypothetical protein
MIDPNVKAAFEALEARVGRLRDTLDKALEILSEIHQENERRDSVFREHKEATNKRLVELEARLGGGLVEIADKLGDLRNAHYKPARRGGPLKRFFEVFFD